MNTSDGTALDGVSQGAAGPAANDDATLIAIAEKQPQLTDGRIHGEIVQAPIFEAPGQTRVGRFGWKG